MKQKAISKSSLNVMGAEEPVRKKKQVKFQQDQVNKEPKPINKRTTQTNINEITFNNDVCCIQNKPLAEKLNPFFLSQ